RDHVRDRLGLDEPLQTRSPKLRHLPPPTDNVDRIACALAIWDEARDPRRTPAEGYLCSPRPRGRGVELPDEAAGRAIRFHPACPFFDQRTPAIVALVRDVVTNEPKAIHRTALDRNGNKVKIGGRDRLTLAPIKGGAV